MLTVNPAQLPPVALAASIGAPPAGGATRTPRWLRGAGQRRDPALSLQARRRRDWAETTAQQLMQGGVPEHQVYAANLADTFFDLASEGTLRDHRGRQRRRWAGFADQAHDRQADLARAYAAFCEEQDISCVVQVVIRPPDAVVALADLRSAHGRLSHVLGDRLRYGRRFAPGFICDIVAAELVLRGSDGLELDLHWHLSVRGNDRDLRAMAAYFARGGWSWWDPVTCGEQPVLTTPEQLGHYLAKGLAAAIHQRRGKSGGLRAHELAELYRQTSGLAMVRSVGAFRAWKAAVDRGRASVAQDSGLTGGPKTGAHTQRPANDAADSSLMVLRLCVHDFGDGVMRPAVLVRGHAAVTFPEVAFVYDLQHAIAAARTAMARTDATPTPESASTMHVAGTWRTVEAKHQPISDMAYRNT